MKNEKNIRMEKQNCIHHAYGKCYKPTKAKDIIPIKSGKIFVPSECRCCCREWEAK